MSIKSYMLGAVASVAIAFSTSAVAHFKTDVAGGDYASGIYMGVAGGYAHTNWSDTEDHLMQLGYTTVDVEDGAVGLKGFLGYDFNEHFGIEFGYLHVFDEIGYKVGMGATVYDKSIEMKAIDAVLKMRVYLDNGFSVYTKLGGAYLSASRAFKLTAPFEAYDPSRINVTFGAGFSYCVTPCFIATLDWQHYRGSDDKEFLADLNFYSFGLAYKFAV